jgi:hypothetical protein
MYEHKFITLYCKSIVCVSRRLFCLVLFSSYYQHSIRYCLKQQTKNVSATSLSPRNSQERSHASENAFIDRATCQFPNILSLLHAASCLQNKSQYAGASLTSKSSISKPNPCFVCAVSLIYVLGSSLPTKLCRSAAVKRDCCP